MDEAARRHGIAFAALAAAWLAFRFVPLHTEPSEAWRAAVRVVQVADSAESGMLEVRGFLVDGGTHVPAGTRGARQRLESAVALENERLAGVATTTTGRIELFPDQGVTALRLSGQIVPFYDHDSYLLQHARSVAAERPLDALLSVRQVLDTRLSEPEEGIAFEETAARRDLGRVLRDVDEALRSAHEECDRALLRFRREASDGAARAEGPFHRRGPLRLVEILAAALLGVTLRLALRGDRRDLPVTVPLALAPTLATLVVLALEGTRFLPIDPVAGTSAAFVPMAFAVGLGTITLLERMTRNERAGLGGPLRAPAPAPTVRREPSPEADPAPAVTLAQPLRVPAEAGLSGLSAERRQTPRSDALPGSAATPSERELPSERERTSEDELPPEREAAAPSSPAPSSPAPSSPPRRAASDAPFFSRPRTERRAPSGRLPFLKRERRPS